MKGFQKKGMSKTNFICKVLNILELYLILDGGQPTVTPDTDIWAYSEMMNQSFLFTRVR